MTNFESVKKFMETFGQEIKDIPNWPDADTMLLRIDLIQEELEEFKDAIISADGTLVDAVGVAPNDTDQIRNGVAGCASGTDNGIKAVIGVMPFAESIVIGPSTRGLQMEYNTSQSMRLDMTGTANDIYKFDVAFFDFTLKAKKARRSRGAWN